MGNIFATFYAFVDTGNRNLLNLFTPGEGSGFFI